MLVRERVLLRAHTPNQTGGLVVIGERLLLRAQPFLVLDHSAHRAQRPGRCHARAHTARDAVCVPRLRLRRQRRRRGQRELVHLGRVQAEVHGEQGRAPVRARALRRALFLAPRANAISRTRRRRGDRSGGRIGSPAFALRRGGGGVAPRRQTPRGGARGVGGGPARRRAARRLRVDDERCGGLREQVHGEERVAAGRARRGVERERLVIRRARRSGRFLRRETSRRLRRERLALLRGGGGFVVRRLDRLALRARCLHGVERDTLANQRGAFGFVSNERWDRAARAKQRNRGGPETPETPRRTKKRRDAATTSLAARDGRAAVAAASGDERAERTQRAGGSDGVERDVQRHTRRVIRRVIRADENVGSVGSENDRRSRAERERMRVPERSGDAGGDGHRAALGRLGSLLRGEARAGRGVGAGLFRGGGVLGGARAALERREPFLGVALDRRAAPLLRRGGARSFVALRRRAGGVDAPRRRRSLRLGHRGDERLDGIRGVLFGDARRFALGKPKRLGVARGGVLRLGARRRLRLAPRRRRRLRLGTRSLDVARPRLPRLDRRAFSLERTGSLRLGACRRCRRAGVRLVARGGEPLALGARGVLRRLDGAALARLRGSLRLGERSVALARGGGGGVAACLRLGERDGERLARVRGGECLRARCRDGGARLGGGGGGVRLSLRLRSRFPRLIPLRLFQRPARGLIRCPRGRLRGKLRRGACLALAHALADLRLFCGRRRLGGERLLGERGALLGGARRLLRRRRARPLRRLRAPRRARALRIRGGARRVRARLRGARGGARADGFVLLGGGLLRGPLQTRRGSRVGARLRVARRGVGGARARLRGVRLRARVGGVRRRRGGARVRLRRRGGLARTRLLHRGGETRRARHGIRGSGCGALGVARRRAARLLRARAGGGGPRRRRARARSRRGRQRFGVSLRSRGNRRIAEKTLVAGTVTVGSGVRKWRFPVRIHSGLDAYAFARRRRRRLVGFGSRGGDARLRARRGGGQFRARQLAVRLALERRRARRGVARLRDARALRVGPFARAPRKLRRLGERRLEARGVRGGGGGGGALSLFGGARRRQARLRLAHLRGVLRLDVLENLFAAARFLVLGGSERVLHRLHARRRFLGGGARGGHRRRARLGVACLLQRLFARELQARDVVEFNLRRARGGRRARLRARGALRRRAAGARRVSRLG